MRRSTKLKKYREELMNKIKEETKLNLNMEYSQLCSSQEYPITSLHMHVLKAVFMVFSSGYQLSLMPTKALFLNKKVIFLRCSM